MTRGNWSSGFPTRYDTDLGRRGSDYPSSENKGADQLRSYCEADLRLCFRIGKNPVSQLICFSFLFSSHVNGEVELLKNAKTHYPGMLNVFHYKLISLWGYLRS